MRPEYRWRLYQRVGEDGLDVIQGEAQKLLREVEAGAWVGTGNGAASAEAIGRLRADAVGRRRLGENGRRFVAAGYSRDTQGPEPERCTS